jgi:hypothetical protein
MFMIFVGRQVRTPFEDDVDDVTGAIADMQTATRRRDKKKRKKKVGRNREDEGERVDEDKKTGPHAGEELGWL